MSTTGSPPVRYPSGVSTSAQNWAFGNYPFPTPPRLNQYFNDFNVYAAGDWTVTTTSGTSALSDGNGGLLTVTTAASSADIQANELVPKSFQFTTGSQAWYSINVNFASATATAFMAGWGNTFAALTPTDGVYFSKPSGAAALTGVIRGSSTSTTIALGSVAAATPYTLTWYYDGKPTPTLYFFTTIGTTAPTGFGSPYFSGGNQVNGSASSETGATNTLVNLPTAALRAGFALKAGTTAAGVAVIDYMLSSEEIIGRF